LFDKNLDGEFEERASELRKFIDNNIFLGSTVYQAVKEWMLINLLLARIETLELLSPLIFRIMYIKGKIHKKTDMIQQYNSEIGDFKTNSRVKF
jgi:hypothetical protein